MWENNRPKNWEKKRDKYLLRDIDISIGNIWPVIYEAGVDAILEELRAVHSLEGFEKMIEVVLKSR